MVIDPNGSTKIGDYRFGTVYAGTRKSRFRAFNLIGGLLLIFPLSGRLPKNGNQTYMTVSEYRRLTKKPTVNLPLNF